MPISELRPHIDRIHTTIQNRKDNMPPGSSTTKLFESGRNTIAAKLGEEGVEVVIAGVTGDKEALTLESSQLLYYTVVMWVDCGIAPGSIFTFLEKEKVVNTDKGNRNRLAQNVGEEAVRVAISGAANNIEGVEKSSAELIFQINNLWEDVGVTPDEVGKQI